MADKPLTYGTYLKVPELLGLQNALSAPPHHDEALFIIIHQVYELWFKLILHEVDTAADEIEQDRLYEGTRLLRRHTGPRLRHRSDRRPRRAFRAAALLRPAATCCARRGSRARRRPARRNA